jgi:AraC family transcriptional activator of pobA
MNLITVDLLFSHKFDRRERSRVSPHKHPFWQVEYVTRGPITILCNGATHLLKKGTTVLVPPLLEHAFSYPRGRTAWSSYKFHLKGAVVLESILFLRHGNLIPELLSLLHRSWEEPGLHNRDLLQANLLQCILSNEPHLSGDRGNDPGAELRERIGHVLDVSGQSSAVSVANVAQALGMRPDYLSAKFRKSTGTSVKAFIDQWRFERASRFLRYSRMSISEIADELGFADVYAFSRHFKRLSGQSPSVFRKAVYP